METYLKWLPNNKILVKQWKLDMTEGGLKDREYVYYILEK
ncbi:unnamed protein product [marine sediment metagenome]|uniref:Uncharacterized protein n=1 Tax=marine sediment metagenome TaxID=412755 RepID=X1BXH3_9ZZZZ